MCRQNKKMILALVALAFSGMAAAAEGMPGMAKEEVKKPVGEPALSDKLGDMNKRLMILQKEQEIADAEAKLADSRKKSGDSSVAGSGKVSAYSDLNLTVKAVEGYKGRLSAIITTPEGLVEATAGDEIVDGWVVKSVSQKEVVLTKGKLTALLKVINIDRSKAQAPASSVSGGILPIPSQSMSSGVPAIPPSMITNAK